MRFRAVVIVGNKKGKVGMGTGKANEVQAAVQKATKDARRHMIRVPLVKGTIPHEVEVKFKAAKVRILPASEGTGIIAGGALRVVLDHAGVRNVLSKRFGTGNKLVNAQATFKALALLKTPRVSDVDVAEAKEKEAAATGQVQVTEITKEEAAQRQDIARKANLDGA